MFIETATCFVEAIFEFKIRGYPLRGLELTTKIRSLTKNTKRASLGCLGVPVHFAHELPNQSTLSENQVMGYQSLGEFAKPVSIIWRSFLLHNEKQVVLELDVVQPLQALRRRSELQTFWFSGKHEKEKKMFVRFVLSVSVIFISVLLC